MTKLNYDNTKDFESMKTKQKSNPFISSIAAK